MLQLNALPHSNFRDAHKGVVFMIHFKSYENGFTATLEIDGLPEQKYPDKIWKDRDQAISDVRNDAIKMIEAAHK